METERGNGVSEWRRSVETTPNGGCEERRDERMALGVVALAER